MKAILEFNLPQDEPDFIIATRAYDYKQALWDLNERFRSLEKYENVEEITISEVRDIFYKILQKNDIEL